MPQVHLVRSRKKAFAVAARKIWPAPDDASAIVAAHLIIEALLHRYLQRKVRHPKKLESVGLRFHQTHSLSKCFRKELDNEAWLWSTLECLNQIRNRLAHNIHVGDLPALINRLFEAAGHHIDVHAPGANPKEREDNKLKFFLIILCGVVRNLQDGKGKI
jgi:hypothetical protein